MRNFNLREEMTEKEETMWIPVEKAKRPCKCSEHKAILHKKQVSSDGVWTRWECGLCGQIKFSKGLTFEEEE